jgi:alpha-L-fucosidase
MTGYGRVDILWLDGGWVRPLSTVDTSVEWQRGIKFDQDIDMPKIASMSRTHQPGLIIVDRTVTGEYENYTTPEQEVPSEPLSYPWETCMTMGGSWSYVPGDKYKSANKLIQLLVKIVSRGGNFLLNVGPGPDGDWDPVVYQRMEELGKWININGEGIYGSKPLPPYSSGNIYLTQSKDGKNKYAFYLSDSANVVLPAEMTISLSLTEKNTVRILGVPGKLKWKNVNGIAVVSIPASLRAKVKSNHAVVFKIE